MIFYHCVNANLKMQENAEEILSFPGGKTYPSWQPTPPGKLIRCIPYPG